MTNPITLIQNSLQQKTGLSFTRIKEIVMQLQTSSLTDLENFSGLEDFQRTLSVFLRKLEVPAKDVSAVVGSVITQIPVSAFSLQLQEFLAYLEDPADISDPLADIDSRILGHKRKS